MTVKDSKFGETIVEEVRSRYTAALSLTFLTPRCASFRTKWQDASERDRHADRRRPRRDVGYDKELRV